MIFIKTSIRVFISLFSDHHVVPSDERVLSGRIIEAHSPEEALKINGPPVMTNHEIRLLTIDGIEITGHAMKTDLVSMS